MDIFGNVVENAYSFGEDGDDKGFCQCILSYKAQLHVKERWIGPPDDRKATYVYLGTAKKDWRCTNLQYSDDTTIDFVDFGEEGGGHLTVTLFRYLKCKGCKELHDKDGKPICTGGGSLCTEKLEFLPNPKLIKLAQKIWKNKNKPATVKKLMNNLVTKFFKSCTRLLRCQESGCPKP